ncbi:hypothetical protein CY34DRAFT_601793 [Suillus luteus UH-Slu-Lm8-n1]|uniref:Uncharacterized protein n=1 Tax=Suillus luteus UH-Slu-Lm8-n1 TaxID=930992 RepID=A0A0D0BEY7_9AGAM|nr:hypothetical protein CY34DRAFT_601793 [Suillus luteus UH-Slu-Lm8-n1]
MQLSVVARLQMNHLRELSVAKCFGNQQEDVHCCALGPITPALHSIVQSRICPRTINNRAIACSRQCLVCCVSLVCTSEIRREKDKD